MDLKKKVKRLAHISEVAMTYKYSALKKTREYYIRHYDQSIVDEKTILYEVRDGQSMTDSPLAIFRYLSNHKKYQHLRHVWVVTDDSSENLARMVANIPTQMQKNIIWVKRNTIAYAKWLLKAKFLITNSTFQSFWHKKPDQIYVNTWHGTPLKYMGYDIPGSKTSLKNVQRNLLMADYIISPNKHTSHVFLDRYKLNGLYQGEILESGYPRIDLTYGHDQAQTISYLLQSGVRIDRDKSIVMYTPTWKGTSITNPSGGINQIFEEVNCLKQLNPDKNILVKVHPYAYQLAKRHDKLHQYLVPDEMDANLILGITDILITDYSSIFFDYLVTDKPIIFYAWDHELYSSYRGMYFDDDELPGPILDDIAAVGHTLQDIDQVYTQYQQKYQQLKEKIVTYDDGQVTERIVQTIFDQQSVPGIKHVHASGLEKTKLLIYPGGMGNNGITTSAINLSWNLDYDKYDVTYLLWDNDNEEIVHNVDQLDDRVRVMYRFGVTALTRPENKLDRYISEHGIKSWSDTNIPKTGYQREADRLFNSAQFDNLIDFSGYSFNGSKLFAVMPRKQLIVYQHNDLYADSQKIINGEKVHAKKLGALFTLYSIFDKIVSVSEILKQINGTKLAKYIRPEQMVAVPNSLTMPTIIDKNLSDSPVIENYQAAASMRQQAVAMFMSLTDIIQGIAVTKEICANEHVSILGRARINQTIFYKLAINDLPSGWIAAKSIDIHEVNELLYQEPVHIIGWVYNNKRRLFQTPYLKGNDTSDVIGQAKWLNHTFIKIVAQAETGDGRYYQVRLPKSRQTAWIKASSILPMQVSPHFAIYQWLWNCLSNKVTERAYHVGIKQLFTITHEVVLTNQPLGLSKRGLKQRQLKSFNKLYVATAFAQTITGNYFRVKIGRKQWWVDEHDINKQIINVPLSNNYQVDLSDYFEMPLNQSLIFNQQSEQIIRAQFGILPDDLAIIAGYSIAKFIDNQPVYQLYSVKFDESMMVSVNDVIVLDISHFNEVYAISREKTITYQNMLLSQQSQQINIKRSLVELARVWNWQAQSFMIYGYFANQYGWFDESVLTSDHVKQLVVQENMLPDEHSGVQLEADTLPVDDIQPVEKINQPWITRKVSVHSAGKHYTQLQRQNGQTTLLTNTGELILATDVQQATSETMLYRNGRQWATYSHFVFVAVGRLSPEKNQTMLLDAFAKIYAIHPEAELIIVGDGVSRDELENQAVALGIANVVLFTGQVDNPADYVALADVFVHPSLYEGQPMVLLEALMQQRLIIATNIAANIGVLGNQEYGLVTKDVTSRAFEQLMLFAMEKQTNLAKLNIEVYQNQARRAFHAILK
ncbi:CDP-glycerol glycerophosphotransferase family protein [Weissella sagaensis]|uniref:CDP-glycerol glycerophosphotransferase family protein n=1 Tax=Weissella sagaensis TaxID=2559928 RepID=A0ABW1RST5_9LACO|nr:glycosyltransferase [Weissella sagaensis]